MHFARMAGVISALGIAVACAALPKAPPHAVAPPKVDALTPITACWLEYLRGEGPAWPVTKGPTKAKTFHGTASGILIKHPRGAIVLDAGNSSHYWSEIKRYNPLRHIFLSQTSGRMKRQALPAAAMMADGVDPKDLLYVLLSHGHIDHAGGMVDLPGVKAKMSADEWTWMQKIAPKRTISVIPAHEKTLRGRVETIEWTTTPYETFDESADLFGDGSVVVVKLPGHTPGSIGTFINVSPTERIFHVGDAVILREQYERGAAKGIGMKWTDYNKGTANKTVEKLVQLHQLDPKLMILPAHDRDVWEDIFGKDPRCLEPVPPATPTPTAG